MIPGDKIFIGLKSNIVKVLGEVSRPGNFQFISGLNFGDYISLAGGFNKEAARRQAYVLYPNGSSKKNFIFSNPKIIDGSEIIIPSREETVPFNFTEYVTNVTSIWADIAQAYVLMLLTLRS